MKWHLPKNMSGQLLRSWPFWLLAMVIIVIYANSLRVPPQFDDLRHFSTYTEVAKQPVAQWPTAVLRFSRPLPIALFIAQFRLTGANVIPLHVVNILIHLAVGIMVFLLSRLLLQELLSQVKSNRQRTALAACIALFFAVHPIQTQAVTYLIQRMTSLAALWYITSLYCLAQAVIRSRQGSRPWGWFVGVVVAGVAALLSKENAYTLPVMGLVVWWFVGRSHTFISRKQWIPFVVSCGTVIAVLLSSYTHVQSFLATRQSTPTDSEILPYMYGLTQLAVYPRYLGMLALPLHQSIDHMPILSLTIDIQVVIGALSLACLLFFAGYAYKRAPIITFGLLWYMITMLVESGVIPISDVFVEHRLYLPSVGMIMAVVVTLFLIAQRVHKERIFYMLIGLLVLLGCVGTVRRNQVWKTELRLWQDAVAKSSNNPRAHYNLAMESIKLGHNQNALLALEETITLRPKFSNAHNNLGVLLFFIGEYELARYHFIEALRYDINNEIYRKNVMKSIDIAEGASPSAEPEYVLEMFN